MTLNISCLIVVFSILMATCGAPNKNGGSKNTSNESAFASNAQVILNWNPPSLSDNFVVSEITGSFAEEMYSFMQQDWPTVDTGAFLEVSGPGGWGNWLCQKSKDAEIKSNCSFKIFRSGQVSGFSKQQTIEKPVYGSINLKRRDRPTNRSFDRIDSEITGPAALKMFEFMAQTIPIKNRLEIGLKEVSGPGGWGNWICYEAVNTCSKNGNEKNCCNFYLTRKGFVEGNGINEPDPRGGVGNH